MDKAFFFEIQQITDNEFFDDFKKRTIFFSYFQVDQKYYLFCYAEKSIDRNFLSQSVKVLQELNSKKRKIRSLRGFFLYVLEIMENGKNYQSLNTNLQPFFWREVQNKIRQNKKSALINFLFPIFELEVPQNFENQIEEIKKIENFEVVLKSLQDQVEWLKERITILENQRNLNILSDASKIGQKTSPTLEHEDSSFKQYSNVPDLFNSSLQEVEPENLSDDSKTPLKAFTTTEQYNLSSTQDKDQDGLNFITLGNLSEQEKIEIIERGFQLNQEGKISLKKYYQSTEKYSLFQFKGYSIKYETIRRTKLYQYVRE